jgi:predicted acylesterase/phospholipase RssA
LSLTLTSPLASHAPNSDTAISKLSAELSADPAALPTFDCLVLSGGGAKGAYGAGVAKALTAYRQLKEVRGPVCYVGASAGALNAYMLATANADELISFWQTATRRNILGPRFPSATIRAMLRVATRPFSIYSNAGLEKLISANACIKTIKSPLIIAATDYTRGRLKAFYASKLIDRLVEEDAALAAEQQRLNHFRRIGTTEVLIKALLASSAIPVFFPPVEITVTHFGSSETGWYIDGGVGNHTPTREAAYFSRYVQEKNLGQVGLVVCVKQDPPRLLHDTRQPMHFFNILTRTLEVYHHVHTAPIVAAWFRINLEVRDQRKRVHQFTEWLRQQDIPPRIVDLITSRATTELVNLGGATPRMSAPLLEIEPSTSLGDPLEFDPEHARQNIEHGYIDTLRVLRDSSQMTDIRPPLTDKEYRVLVDLPVFAERPNYGTLGYEDYSSGAGDLCVCRKG